MRPPPGLVRVAARERLPEREALGGAVSQQIFEGLLDDFLMESRERAGRVEELLLTIAQAEEGERPGLLDHARRELHTLKGNAGMMGFQNIQAQAHHMEDEVAALNVSTPDISVLLASLDRLRALLAARFAGDPGAAASAQESRAPEEMEQAIGSVRVPFSALDDLMDLLAEMVIFRNRLGDAIFRGRMAGNGNGVWEDVQSAQEALRKTLGFIQERFMQLRMVPLQTLFGRLRRIVHDEAAREGKKARLDTAGGDVSMDKALLDVASEALGHLVRNAIVHGIEPPGKRAAAGKAPEGTVRLTAHSRSGEVWVDVEDDGGGIDRDALMAVATARGLAVPAGEDVYQLLFVAGFTTRESADVGSGRGIGLSAALRAVQAMGGSLVATSEAGRGTRFRIRLPLSVSIIRAMLLGVDGEEYALPLGSIIESIRFRPGDGHQINHAGVVAWRDRVIPVVDLGHLHGTAPGIRESGYVVLIEAEGRQRGLVVDQLAGIREIVVKGLDPLVGNPEGIAGSTIMGNGRVVLILDPRGLVALQPFLVQSAGEGVR